MEGSEEEEGDEEGGVIDPAHMKSTKGLVLTVQERDELLKNAR